MIRVFREHPEFGEFTRVDTDLGRLLDIPESEFLGLLPEGFREDHSGLQRVDGRSATVFTGKTPHTHTRFPRRVYFQITRNCNLECSYCFVRARRGQPHVPTSAVLDMATFLGRHGLVEVRLTGGEPTTHPGFFEILHRFREEGVFVSVATNGVLDRRTLDQLADERGLWVICSVDGGRDAHDRYRPGTFHIVVDNLRYLKERNPAIRIRLTSVLTRSNKGQIHELGKICRSIDAESITVIPLRPQVRDPAVLADMVTAQEFKQVIEELVTARQQLGISFTTTLETDYALQICRDPVVRKRSSCAAGREATNLDFDASTKQYLLYGCSYSPAADLEACQRIRQPFVAGEFPMDDPPRLLDIWWDDTAWTIFRDLSIKSNDCGVCSYYADHTCVGSCPIQNVNYGAIDCGGDILTQLRKQIAGTSEWYCYKRIVGPSATRSV